MLPGIAVLPTAKVGCITRVCGSTSRRRSTSTGRTSSAARWAASRPVTMACQHQASSGSSSAVGSAAPLCSTSTRLAARAWHPATSPEGASRTSGRAHRGFPRTKWEERSTLAVDLGRTLMDRPERPQSCKREVHSWRQPGAAAAAVAAGCSSGGRDLEGGHQIQTLAKYSQSIHSRGSSRRIR